jgi:hypothetical protein
VEREWEGITPQVIDRYIVFSNRNRRIFPEAFLASWPYLISQPLPTLYALYNCKKLDGESHPRRSAILASAEHISPEIIWSPRGQKSPKSARTRAYGRAEPPKDAGLSHTAPSPH